MEKEITTKEIPDDIIEKARSFIECFCTALIYKGDLIGSGTLIRHGSKFGILTAHHVINETSIPFGSGSNAILGLSISKNTHRFELDARYCRPISIKKTDSEEYGPDMSFIEILDQQKLNTVRAFCSFWNIDSLGQNKFENCKKNKYGIWAISGFPYEDLKRNNNELDLNGTIGFSGIEKRFQRGVYDYLELSVNYSSRDKLPINFKGISGGGLWKIPLKIDMSTGEKIFEMENPIFSGVVFYQTKLNNNYRFLRCHGPISVYDQLSKRIKQQTNRLGY